MVDVIIICHCWKKKFRKNFMTEQKEKIIEVLNIEQKVNQGVLSFLRFYYYSFFNYYYYV